MHTSSVRWGAVLLVALASAACGEMVEEPITSAPGTPRSEALSQVGMERLVPLRFLLLQSFPDPAFSPNVVSWEDIQGSVQTANVAFRQAGIQFYVASATRVVLPSLYGAYDGTLTSWASVRPDLETVFPSIVGASNLPASSTPNEKRWWLDYAATRFSAPEELVVWVTHDATEHQALQADEARSVKMSGPGMGDYFKFVHELGHAFGLNHGCEEDGALEVVCLPSATTTCDRNASPQVGVATLVDFWDLVYKPGSGAGSVAHTFFRSRSEAAAWAPSSLRWIDDESIPGRCTVSWTFPGSLTCLPPGTDLTTETWSTATGSKLKGLMWVNGSSGRNGSSLMNPRLIPPAAQREWPAGFSNSQVEQIRRTLRHDIRINRDGLLLAAGATGGRPLLGRPARRRPLERLDFDNDGKRDLAVWIPPLTPTTTGLFRVKTSSSNFTNEITMSFGALGDTPVIADYNGDGISDFAVVHETGTIHGGLEHTWRWCLSTPGSPPTHSCATPGQYVWGYLGDLPLPGTRFDPSKPGEVAVYRPSDRTVYVAYPSTGTWVALPVGVVGAYQPAPFIGLFDSDTKSDIATYSPNTATFRVWRSQQSWAVENAFAFCPGGAATCPFIAKGVGTSAERAGSVPIWGLQSMHNVGGTPNPTAARSGLGLWDPSNGTWNVMWAPLSSAAIETHQWGILEDVPVGDAVGLKASDTIAALGKRSDLVAYRGLRNDSSANLYRCAFPASTYGCPYGAAFTDISISGGEPRSGAFALPDMVSLGDGKPELCVLFHESMTVRCYTSDSGFGSYIERSFQTVQGEFLLGATLMTPALRIAGSLFFCFIAVGACASDGDDRVMKDGNLVAAGGGGSVPTGGAAGSPAAEPGPLRCPTGRGPEMVAIELPDTPGFCIDSTEVTQGQYAAFLADKTVDPAKQSREICRGRNPSFIPEIETDSARGCPAGIYDPAKKADVPMSCIGFCDAVGSCEWAGKRLCGSVDGGAMKAEEPAGSPKSQWYLACSQGGKTKYPYGDDPQPGKCDTRGEAKALAPATNSECAGETSPFDRVKDLSGNAWEWEDSCSDESFCRIRGGAAGTNEVDTLLCSSGPPFPAHGGMSATPTVGFRCCADGEKP